MTKQHLQEVYARPLRKVSDDLEREADLGTSQRLTAYLDDEKLVADVRQRVESERILIEAYGDHMITHDYVTLTIGHLADALRDRRSS